MSWGSFNHDINGANRLSIMSGNGGGKNGSAVLNLNSLFMTALVVFLFLSVILMPYLDRTTGSMARAYSPSAQQRLNMAAATTAAEAAATTVTVALGSKGKKRENKKKGLYATVPNSLVVERGPDFVRESIAAGTTLVCIYYATWCPHCKSFAPTFLRLARQHSEAYGVLFAAVDCAEYEHECDRMKITGYPTIAAFNFPKDSASVTGAYGSRIESDAVPKYFKDFGMRLPVAGSEGKGEAGAAPGDGEDGAAAKASLQGWMEESVTARARTAPPALRLADALASLEYLLITETPRLVMPGGEDASALAAAAARESMDALQALLELVVAVLPPKSRKAAWPDLEPAAALQWVKDNRAHVVEEKAWRLGLQAALRPATAKNLRSKGGAVVAWQVCSVSHRGKQKVSAGQVQGQGYTCGLWLLMHFLTVAGGRSEAAASAGVVGSGAVQAVRVQATIRSTIGYLFTCSACRTHFLKAFDDCAYNRCTPADSSSAAAAAAATSALSYPRLQLWLYRLHNSVTMRIFTEKSGPYPETLALRRVSRQVLWPDPDVELGEKGGKENIVVPAKVLAHLREAYWDPAWGSLQALPGEEALQVLIE